MFWFKTYALFVLVCGINCFFKQNAFSRLTLYFDHIAILKDFLNVDYFMNLGGRHMDRHTAMHWTRPGCSQSNSRSLSRHFRLLLRRICWLKMQLCLQCWASNQFALQSGWNVDSLSNLPWRPERKPGRLRLVSRPQRKTEKSNCRSHFGCHPSQPGPKFKLSSKDWFSR